VTKAPPAQVAAHNLRVDQVTAEVLRAFDGEGVASVLLKGPSTVRWLYPDRPRRYHDCDLLLSPAAVGDAERVLHGLGFTPTLEQGAMPNWWREHAIEWRHQERCAAVDLHHTLKGAGVDDMRLWQVLHAENEPMTVGGYAASVLALPGRALVLALQAREKDVSKQDLARAVERAGMETWKKAAELAEELDATAGFSAGLRLVPRGRALAATLELPPADSVGAALLAKRAPAESLTVDRIVRARGMRERFAIVRHKLLPPPTFMRHWSPQARRGWSGLLAAYGRRLVWVVRSVPRAVRAWRDARREVQGRPPGGA
jgi:hypothetical protein